MADFLRSHRDVACRMQCEGESPFWVPYIASPSLYKLAKACHRKPVRVRQILSKNIGAEHHCPSSCWIGRNTIDPLSNDINPQITPPSPRQVASFYGELPRCIQLAHFPSRRGKSALATADSQEVGGGDTMNGGLAWLTFTTNIVFWWFLQTYMTSRCCSCWFLLRFEQRIFWY